MHSHVRWFVATSPFSAWAAGLGVFFATAIILSGNLFNWQDLGAFAIWSAIAVLIVVPAFYWPLFSLLRKILKSRALLFAFPLFAVCLALLPTSLLAGNFAGNSPSPLFFVPLYAFFTTVGIVISFAVALRED